MTVSEGPTCHTRRTAQTNPDTHNRYKHRSQTDQHYANMLLIYQYEYNMCSCAVQRMLNVAAALTCIA